VDIAAGSNDLGEAGLVQWLRMCAVSLPPFLVFYSLGLALDQVSCFICGNLKF
jgi:hypothetical protein